MDSFVLETIGKNRETIKDKVVFTPPPRGSKGKETNSELEQVVESLRGEIRLLTAELEESQEFSTKKDQRLEELLSEVEVLKEELAACRASIPSTDYSEDLRNALNEINQLSAEQGKSQEEINQLTERLALARGLEKNLQDSLDQANAELEKLNQIIESAYSEIEKKNTQIAELKEQKVNIGQTHFEIASDAELFFLEEISTELQDVSISPKLEGRASISHEEMGVFPHFVKVNDFDEAYLPNGVRVLHHNGEVSSEYQAELVQDIKKRVRESISTNKGFKLQISDEKSFLLNKKTISQLLGELDKFGVKVEPEDGILYLEVRGGA